MPLRSLFQRASSAPGDADSKFWAWFVANSARLHGISLAQNRRLAAELGRRLGRVAPNIVWQTGAPDHRGVQLLEISADGKKELIQAVLQLTKAAPVIPGWEIVAFRQPTQGIERASIAGMNVHTLRYVSWQDGNKLGINLYVDGLSRQRERELMTAVFILVDSVIGEYAAMTRISEFVPAPLTMAPPHHRPIIELRDELGIVV